MEPHLVDEPEFVDAEPGWVWVRATVPWDAARDLCGPGRWAMRPEQPRQARTGELAPWVVIEEHVRNDG